MAGFRTDIEKFNASAADIIKRIKAATVLTYPVNLVTALQNILFRIPLRWPTVGFHLEYPAYGEDIGSILLMMRIFIPKVKVPFLLTQGRPTKVWVHAKDQEFDVYSQSFFISLLEYEALNWSGVNVYEDHINEVISWFVQEVQDIKNGTKTIPPE